METLSTLLTIETQIIHVFTRRTHLLRTYDVRDVFKRPITLLKVLCALRIEENLQKLVRQLASFQWNHVAKILQNF